MREIAWDNGNGAPPPFAGPFALTGIVNTGQSLSLAAQSTSTVFGSQPYNNVRLQDSAASLWAPSTAFASGVLMNPYPNGVGGSPYWGGVLYKNNGSAGVSASAWDPVWSSASTTPGATVTDGTITWTCIGPSSSPYDISGSNVSGLSLVPATAPIRPELLKAQPNMPYPQNMQGVESVSIAMANALTRLARQLGGDMACSISDIGSGGYSITAIEKGGTSNNYAAGIFEVTQIKRLANLLGKGFGVGCTLLIHGEADFYYPGYQGLITTLQQNCEADYQAITGQSQPIPMIASQQSSTPLTTIISGVLQTQFIPQSALDVLAASRAFPNRFICSGPKYYLNYLSGSPHLRDGTEYVKMAEKKAQVYLSYLMGIVWKPLAPNAFAASIGGTTCTITFDVMFGPLQFDTSIGLNHQTSNTQWANGMGFEALDNSGNLTITSAVIQNGNQVVLTFSRAIAAGLTVQYAWTTDTISTGAFTTSSCDKPGGHYGNLKDNDPSVGPFTGYAHQNWCCIFRQQAIT